MSCSGCSSPNMLGGMTAGDTGLWGQLEQAIVWSAGDLGGRRGCRGKLGKKSTQHAVFYNMAPVLRKLSQGVTEYGTTMD